MGLPKKTIRPNSKLACNQLALLKEPDTNSWNSELLDAMVDEEEKKAILVLNWPQENQVDELVWSASNDGKFNVRSCFELMHEANEGQETFKWKRL